MTIYNRPRAEVFAENAPPSEIQPFQAWLRGLGIAFDETNGFPEFTGLNGLFNALNQYIKYLEQNGFAEWSADLEYPIGAGVRVGAVWYRAKTQNTNKPPAISQNDWALFLNGADVASASTTVKGIVQLNNTLNSTSITQALTAAQGKALQDGKLGRSENAVSASQLQTARTIGGVSFNGTANINLPGVNIAGNQNTSGNAATATRLQTARTIGGVSFNGTANINLPGVNTTGNQNTTGNAATATTAANCSRSIVAGNGLSGGGALTANRTITLGTPGTVTASTGNTVGASSHTHNLDIDGFFPGTKSTNGYQRLPGGLILQWGRVVSSVADVSFNFPQAFPVACLNLGCTNNHPSGFPENNLIIRSISRTGATIGNISTAHDASFMWTAIGY